MPYAWTKTISAGMLMVDELMTEIAATSDYIVSAHCPANYTSNHTSKNAAVNSHNASVYSSDRSSVNYGNNSYSSGYSGYWSSHNLGSKS
jgi:hypothetical protein